MVRSPKEAGSRGYRYLCYHGGMWKPNAYLYYVCAGLAEYGCEWVAVRARSKEEAEEILTAWCKETYNEFDYKRANYAPSQGTQITVI